MLNKIWMGMITASLLYSMGNGTAPETVSAGLASCKESLSLLFTMLGIMCFFNGFLRIAEEAGVTKKLAVLFRPLLGRIFPDVPKDSEAFSAITMNFTANLLGMGNAATPFGISAMEKLKQQHFLGDRASHAMCMLVVINTASLQLIPTTILSLRMEFGSLDPYCIMLPVWICSLFALTVGIAAAGYFRKREERRL